MENNRNVCREKNIMWKQRWEGEADDRRWTVAGGSAGSLRG
jgi:hypothetical protein